MKNVAHWTCSCLDRLIDEFKWMGCTERGCP
jgi:hypothetical protein